MKTASRPSPRLPLSELHLEAQRRLGQYDQRLTSLRRQLLNVFQASQRPLSVQETLEAAGPELPVSSVYRNLTVMSECGILHRLNFDEGFVRYELEHSLTAHHHHLICGQCQRVIDLDDATLAKVEDEILNASRHVERQHGFAVRDHQVELVGTCSDCQAELAS